MGFLDDLIGPRKPRHRSGQTAAQTPTSRHGGGNGSGQPAPPRRIVSPQKCPCGKGKPIGHAGKCKIPTGTYRNGQRPVQTRAERSGRQPSRHDKYIKPMGKGI